MRIDKIGRLLQAFSSSASNSQSGKSIDESQKTERAIGSEAVSLPADFGSQSTEAREASSKVSRIKSAVQSGSYNVSSEDIAQALARELFA